MTKGHLCKVWLLLCVTFILFCLCGERSVAQRQDTADVAIYYKTSYPGRFAELEVRLKNPVAIAGFQFMITLSNPELFDFRTDSIRVEDVLMRVDTCTWEPPPPHDSTCFVDSVVPAPVRYCYIDTVGSLISDFEIVECHGDTGDTSLPDCKWVQILGMGQLVGDSIYIEPNPSQYKLLFKLGVDVFCLSDTVSDRNVSFYMFPGNDSFLSDRQGNTVPFEYHQGDLTVMGGVPGDCSGDSLVDLSDLLFLVSYLYKGGAEPCIPETGDANGDCEVELADLLFLVSYLYKGGAPPNEGCWHGSKRE